MQQKKSLMKRSMTTMKTAIKKSTKQWFIISLALLVIVLLSFVFVHLFLKWQHEHDNLIHFAPISSETVAVETKPTMPIIPKEPFSMYLETKVHIYDELGRILPNAYATIGVDEDNFNELRNRYGNFSLVGDAVRTIISTADFEENVDVNEPAFQHLILWNFKDVPYGFNDKDYLLKVISLHLPEGYEEDKSQPMTKTSSSLFMDYNNPRTKNALIEFKIYTKKMK